MNLILKRYTYVHAGVICSFYLFILHTLVHRLTAVDFISFIHSFVGKCSSLLVDVTSSELRLQFFFLSRIETIDQHVHRIYILST